jgi:hypothetical protein
MFGSFLDNFLQNISYNELLSSKLFLGGIYMALIKIGENYFNQDEVVYIDCKSECYAAHVYLKGMEKPVRVFPVNEDDIKIIGQK